MKLSFRNAMGGRVQVMPVLAAVLLIALLIGWLIWGGEEE